MALFKPTSAFNAMKLVYLLTLQIFIFQTNIVSFGIHKNRNSMAINKFKIRNRIAVDRTNNTAKIRDSFDCSKIFEDKFSTRKFSLSQRIKSEMKNAYLKHCEVRVVHTHGFVSLRHCFPLNSLLFNREWNQIIEYITSTLMKR